MKDYVFMQKDDFYLIPADVMPIYPLNMDELNKYTIDVDEQKSKAIKVENKDFLMKCLLDAQKDKSIRIKKTAIYELPRNYTYRHQTNGMNVIIIEDEEAKLWDELYRLMILRTPWNVIGEKFTLMRKERKINKIEKSKGRSSSYWQMSAKDQWAEDKRLGLLDWDGK